MHKGGKNNMFTPLLFLAKCTYVGIWSCNKHILHVKIATQLALSKQFTMLMNAGLFPIEELFTNWLHFLQICWVFKIAQQVFCAKTIAWKLFTSVPEKTKWCDWSAKSHGVRTDQNILEFGISMGIFIEMLNFSEKTGRWSFSGVWSLLWAVHSKINSAEDLVLCVYALLLKECQKQNHSN